MADGAEEKVRRVALGSDHGGLESKCALKGYLESLGYEVGTFDTPTLIEAWRTAPYLHDGSAATMRDVLTEANQGDRHGKTSHLNADQLNDLVEYLLSL